MFWPIISNPTFVFLPPEIPLIIKVRLFYGVPLHHGCSRILPHFSRNTRQKERVSVVFQMLMATLTVIIGLSPIWPIGTNPSVGDPFIIVNKTTNRLAFFNDSKLVMDVPVATGVTKELTPEGEFTIIVKAKDPYYRKKDIPGGDLRNPLGARWIGFDARGTDGRTYGIHGTNNPASIGHYVSNGCIRMLNEQVIKLFDQVPIGTKILITRSTKEFWQLAHEKGAV